MHVVLRQFALQPQGRLLAQLRRHPRQSDVPDFSRQVVPQQNVGGLYVPVDYGARPSLVQEEHRAAHILRSAQPEWPIEPRSPETKQVRQPS